MSSIFNSALFKSQPVSNYHPRYESKASFNFGYLVPIFCKNVYPGDRWSMSLQSFIRTVPLMSPVMHRNDIKVDAFFVPMRLIWKSAPEFYACKDGVTYPKVSTSHPEMYAGLFAPGGLYDYFNFGTPSWADIVEINKELVDKIVMSDIKKSALPLRAYRMIYDFYFRNKSIEDEITVKFPDFYGDDDFNINLLDSDLLMQLRPWRRDIFTSSLPDPQNGTDVMIPQADLNIESDGFLSLNNDDLSSPLTQLSVTNEGDVAASGVGRRKYSKGLEIKAENSPTIRQLRYANQLEEFEEAMARAGFSDGKNDSSRFKEWLRAIWGVKSSDARLDRPEYLGGYRGPIQISEVPQTSVSTENSPQGNLAGKGLSVGGNRLFNKMSFEEPGIIMVIMSIVPKSAYCQGDPREWLMESGFDLPNPYFDRLGEQDVKMQELNCLADVVRAKGIEVDETFGYNIRNYFAKDFPDEVHGALRTNLAYWHEGRIFEWLNFLVLIRISLKLILWMSLVFSPVLKLLTSLSENFSLILNFAVVSLIVVYLVLVACHETVIYFQTSVQVGSAYN